ncbi:hypothetical protein GCM10028864_38610 [Microlunatus parietis]
MVDLETDIDGVRRDSCEGERCDASERGRAEPTMEAGEFFAKLNNPTQSQAG